MNVFHLEEDIIHSPLSPRWVAQKPRGSVIKIGIPPTWITTVLVQYRFLGPGTSRDRSQELAIYLTTCVERITCIRCTKQLPPSFIYTQRSSFKWALMSPPPWSLPRLTPDKINCLILCGLTNKLSYSPLCPPAPAQEHIEDAYILNKIKPPFPGLRGPQWSDPPHFYLPSTPSSAHLSLLCPLSSVLLPYLPLFCSLNKPSSIRPLILCSHSSSDQNILPSDLCVTGSFLLNI